jgi:hypothetical protein
MDKMIGALNLWGLGAHLLALSPWELCVFAGKRAMIGR